ncbi:hypothetical protein ACP4OV_024439 [Aristida adscensionis]
MAAPPVPVPSSAAPRPTAPACSYPNPPSPPARLWRRRRRGRGHRPCAGGAPRRGAWWAGRPRRSRPSAARDVARQPLRAATALARCFRQRCGAPMPPTYSGSSSSRTPRVTRRGRSRRLPSATSSASRSTSSSSFRCSSPCSWFSPARIAGASSDGGLFNFVIAWTWLFAPLLFTDYRRDRFKGPLDVLWGFQMLLTNTFLIPYMAIRLNDSEADQFPPQTSKLESLMVSFAPTVGAIGGLVCILSIVWALFGRADAGFGGIEERWHRGSFFRVMCSQTGLLTRFYGTYFCTQYFSHG